MRRILKTAAAVTATSLAGLGLLGAASGTASAATNEAVTGCNLGGSLLSGLGGLTSLLTASVTPTCSASPSTVDNLTSLTVDVDTSFFTALENVPGIDGILGLLGDPLAVNVSYTLSCSVNGQTATYNGSFQAKGTAATDSHVVNLQAVVGSPEPNSCTISNLTATSLVNINSAILSALNLNDFSFGVSVTADTSVPGGIWMSTGTTSRGVNADICVDDRANGNAGSAIQAYQCNSDLAQFWTQTAGGQLVRNGDCLTDTGGVATLDQCTGGAAQQWTVAGTGGEFGAVTNVYDGKCLTAPSPLDGAQLDLTACNGAADQQWTGPGKS